MTPGRTAQHVPPPAEAQLRDEIERLGAENAELARSVEEITLFQQKLKRIAFCRTAEEIVETAIGLIDEVIEFVFYRVELKDASGSFAIVSEACPGDIRADEKLLRWAMANREPSVLPRPEEGEGESLIVLPLASRSEELGAILLWVDTDAAALTRGQSNVLNLLCREVSAALELSRLGERIEEARSFLQNVIEGVPLGILAVDGRDRVSMVNGTAEFMFRIVRGGVVGKAYRKALSPALADAVQAMIQQAGKGVEAEEQEIKFQLEGQVSVSLGLSVSPMVGPEGEPEGYVFIARDLALSREIVKLRELDTMKNDFLSLVSHELRTPLASIMSYAEMLTIDGMVTEPAERSEYLGVILSEGERLNRLVTDVLDLTKMEAGKLEYAFEETDPAELIRTSITNSKPVAEKKSIALTGELPEDLPRVRMDPDRIMQTMMNLLSNAIKFTGEGGSIAVRARLLRTEAGAQVEVSVRDTGIGIAPENMSKVFSKFEQIEKIDHHSVGTGLGMPICRQIVEEGHGGRIWIESELGKGTTVFFTLPA